MDQEVNPQILRAWLAGMSLPERARTLKRIAHELTMCTREFESAAEPFTEPFKDPARSGNVCLVLTSAEMGSGRLGSANRVTTSVDKKIE
jgi:hypothetical protein